MTEKPNFDNDGLVRDKTSRKASFLMSDPLSLGSIFSKSMRFGGRPPTYADPDHLQQEIQSFFDECDVNSAPPTIAGLTAWLGFTDRRSVRDYHDTRPDFAPVLRAGFNLIAHWHERRVSTEASVQGSIFILKNLSYTDNSQVSLLTPEDSGKKTGKEIIYKIGDTEITFTD